MAIKLFDLLCADVTNPMISGGHATYLIELKQLGEKMGEENKQAVYGPRMDFLERFGQVPQCKPMVDSIKDWYANRTLEQLATKLDEQASDALRGTVHASFSSQDAMDMAAVQNAVNKAGYVWTTHHQGQTQNWFEVWEAKAKEAAYLIVVFCVGYRSRFTPALKQEADW